MRRQIGIANGLVYWDVDYRNCRWLVIGFSG
jgi:hypothetical protein